MPKPETSRSSRAAGSIAPETMLESVPRRLSTADNGFPAVEDRSALPVEAPLTIDIIGVGAYTIMCTPTDLHALAVGFAFTEGIIKSLDDIAILQRCEDDPSLVRIRLKERAGAKGPGRNLAVVSSCGLCGSRSLPEILASLPKVPDKLKIAPFALKQMNSRMRERQVLYSATGGTHAAAIFNAVGEFLSFGEDIGRHNALDKAIGLCLLKGLPTAGCAAVVSGRLSLEMVVKAAQAGLELLSAVSAPTSLALRAAQQANITVCGFVREDRATVYTHPRRVG